MRVASFTEVPPNFITFRRCLPSPVARRALVEADAKDIGHGEEARALLLGHPSGRDEGSGRESHPRMGAVREFEALGVCGEIRGVVADDVAKPHRVDANLAAAGPRDSIPAVHDL